MAANRESPALKRKREGAEPQRKKVKTQVKTEDVQMNDISSPATPKVAVKNMANGEAGTPTLSKKERKKLQKQSAGKQTPQASTPADASAVKSEEALTNGVHGGSATPSLSRKEKKSGNTPATAHKSEDGSNEVTESNELAPTPSKKAQKNKHKSKQNKGPKSAGSPWSWSTSMGGWFLPEDPVFTSDEKHLILANAGALQVYAADTSSLARTLQVRSGSISTYALSANNPNHVYTANAAGLITLWDWTEGTIVGRWDIGTNVHHLTVVSDPKSHLDLVYSHETGNSHIVNVHALRTRQQPGQTELKQILKTKSPITGMQVLLEGKIVVISLEKSVMIGKRSKTSSAALQDFRYIWREFQLSKHVSAFDAYMQTPEQAEKDSGETLDLAVGDRDGVIWLFEDILASFARIEKGKKEGPKAETSHEMLRPKRLHWHREAVASVKFSRDGNYIISGGAETVLVIWQLSTGKQQHLPHLTAAIENIVVSPTGASYSVTLANNSVVVLSTTELEPKSNIVGIQSRRVDPDQFPQQIIPDSYSFGVFNEIPMVVDPKSGSQVIFPVPSSQPRHGNAGLRPEPYMQTFDIASQHAISRQALTRNNATDVNMAPEGRHISEPNVKLLQTSTDGKWLATVDEWIPSPEDMGFLDEGIPEFTEEERTFRREVYLKFWQWDEKSAQWTLDSRIDAPHFLESVGAGARVLDLVADPVETGFATIGEDCVVRVWRPKTRLRDGTVVRGADKNNGEGLVTWSLYRSIKLSSNLDVLAPHSEPRSRPSQQSSCLAFSPDGSVLAAGVAEADSGVIHIIDAIEGTIRRSITELDIDLLSSIGILGRHMVVVGRSVVVWDLVTDELVQCIGDDTLTVDRFAGIPLSRLAINAESGTFAVVLQHFNNTSQSAKAKNPRSTIYSTVSIFDPYQPQPLWKYSTPNVILALASAKNGKGYIALDSSSSISLITPDSGVWQLPSPPPEDRPLLVTEGEQMDEDDVEDVGEESKGGALASLTAEALLDSENDKPVVRPEMLQDVFDMGPSHALPPVRDLFNAVVGLYARKPRVGGTL